MTATLGLRPVAEGDEALLYQVYASTREQELALLGWDPGQRDQFLKMQFMVQSRAYRQQFPHAAFDVVLVDGVPAGRLYVDRQAARLHVIDVALLPAFRNQGLGTRLLRGVQDAAAATGAAVNLYVDRANPALRLYTRLGFHVVCDTGVYLLLEWLPLAEDCLVLDAGGGLADRHQEQVEAP